MTDTRQTAYELTPNQGGLYGEKVSSSKCFSSDASGCAVSQRFNDHFNAKVFEVINQYQPDVLYTPTGIRLSG